MSDTPPNPTNPVIDFRQKKREYIIRRVMQMQRLPPEKIAKLFQFHDFLLYVDEAKKTSGDVDQEILSEYNADIKLIEEKFDELFEIVK